MGSDPSEITQGVLVDTPPISPVPPGVGGTRVGFIGLGSQGGPMARRIADEGYPLTVWARRAASVEPFAGVAAVASTPAEVGESSDVVGICVVADADVEDVLLRDDGVLAGMAAGGVVVIHSTIRPETCQRLAAEAAKQEISIIDAPVSGGGDAAAQRRLLVMVGGEDDAVARCRPVLEAFARPVIHLGPLGSGQVAKLVNNFVFTAQVGLALETFSFAQRLGMDRVAAAQVLAHGSGGTRASAILAASGFDTTGLRQAEPLLRKDVGIVLDVARAAGVPEPAALVELARNTLSALGNGPKAQVSPKA
ncbi:6-phosphogluconate dehydrogenase NAD-binding [Parafrankia sp. Ea1.12]|uniref:NAD(P)-dependent oxidoreductase n=1 Tax=Parafrankia sp. Ea1.12 TaxID=573499 RepID=UPI000DA55D04|nr:NAD(P)-dependent oxidoreductase [Parafrankia sp. Ea1.12]SQD98622.1 6-phosphogluconate dehydrogenase NAD-binding [Parafrankia sp. Ea1.12]